MARNSMIHNIVDDLAFECPICTEAETVEIRLYPCQHFGCSGCIEQFDRVQNQPNTFLCPECKRPVIIPPEGLPLHREAQRINEQRKKLSDALEARNGQGQAASTSTTLPTVTEVVETGASNTNVVNEPKAKPKPRNDLVEECEALVKEDEQCVFDGRCHKSCGYCGESALLTLKESFVNPGGGKCSGKMGCLLLPCWVFQLLKIAIPCCAVFNPDGVVRPERGEIAQMRIDAKRVVAGAQHPIFPSWFRAMWAFLMLAASLTFVGTNVYQILNHNWIFSTVACSINGLFGVMWLTFSIVNIVHYKPGEEQLIKKDGNSLSYFAMEQTQQFLSEYTVYPQLCMSAMMLPEYDASILVSFVGCVLILLAVFSLRLFTVIKMRDYMRKYFGRFVSSLVGNYFLVVYLVLVLVFISFTRYSADHLYNFLLQGSLSSLILITNGWNHCMFYIAHAYEISLQSGLNLLHLKYSKPRLVRALVTRLTNLEAFHKNMYGMSSPCYGTLLYFWTFPSLAVSLIFWIEGYYIEKDLTLFFLLCGYCGLLLAANHKTTLLNCSAHFTCFVIVSLLFVTCFLSMALTCLIYAPIIAVVALLCCLSIVCSKSESDKPYRYRYYYR